MQCLAHSIESTLGRPTIIVRLGSKHVSQFELVSASAVGFGCVCVCVFSLAPGFIKTNFIKANTTVGLRDDSPYNQFQHVSGGLSEHETDLCITL